MALFRSTAARGSTAALGLYRRLPDDVRRCLRPLNLVDEIASFLPSRVRAPTVTATEMVRRLDHLRRIRYPVRRLDGVTRVDARPLSCIVAADELSSRYWTRTLFADTPAERTLGVVPALAVRATAARLAPTVELSLWQASWPVSRLGARSAVVPASVPMWLDTGASLDAIIRREPGRGSRHEEVRRARRLALACRPTSGPRDWAEFRRTLYEPYTRRRFGELFVDVPAHVLRHARRQGRLLLLEDRGRAVAGAVVERWGRDARILVFGVETEGPTRPTTLLAACYYHAIAYAVAAGVGRFSLGTTRPTLSDGVLRYKRKWGAAIGKPKTWDTFLLCYRNTPAVRAVLTDAPLVLDRGRHGLAALVAAVGRDPRAHLEWGATPGLAEMAYLLGDGEEPPRDPRLADARLAIVPPGSSWP
jgi:phosphoglycolate phosphatase-like HAD superfamily hydrolase